MNDQIILGYWNIRGLAHSIRLLLRHVNANFKEELYDEMNMDTWKNVKPSLNVDFPNLPYIFDGKVKISQSVAILRHLGRKFNLAPTNHVDQARLDVLEMQIMDWRTVGFEIWYGPKDKFNKELPAHHQVMKDQMAQLSRFMGAGPFVLGDKLTYIDFMLYEFLDNQRRLFKGLLAPHKNLEHFVKHMEHLPKVKAYLESDEYKKVNFITAHMANWGNRKNPNHMQV